MTRGIRIVVPFRPFRAESDLHRQVEAAGFDWIEALQMVMHSAAVACRCPVHAITDVDTDLPVPTLKYATTSRRLMLWTLDVCAAYLGSKDCDRDTVMLDVDQLVYQDLAEWCHRDVDLGVLIRTHTKHANNGPGQPLLNGVQFWSGHKRKALEAFFRRAVQVAVALPEDRLVWGADTDAMRILLAPFAPGVHERSGLVVEMIEADRVLETYSTVHEQRMTLGEAPWPSRPVLDFRWLRKSAMPVVYRATIGQGAVQ